MRTADFPPFFAGGLSFDSSRNVVVFFGGYNGTLLRETWEWSGYNWTKLVVGTPAVSSVDISMAYDSFRHVTVMVAPDGGNILRVWEYDGQAWTQRGSSTIPSPRFSFNLAFDSKRNVTVLFGGLSIPNAQELNDTWEWDGNDWILRTPSNAPSTRRSPAMVYDLTRSRTVLFGGNSGLTNFNDTWEWDGEDWTQVLTSVHPPARAGYLGVFDSKRGKTVLYSPSAISPRLIWEYPSSSPPVIASVLKAQNVCLGDSVTLGIAANSDTPASYQWRRDGNYIPGATSSEYHIASADFGSPGVYDVIVTNDCGSTTSVPASLTVCAGPDGCPSPLDVNADGLVNGADIQRIVEVLLGL